MARVEIKDATTDDDYAAGKILIEEYADALGVDLCFQGFADELIDLRRMYGPPDGCLLLARAGAEVAGCVAVRKQDGRTCEMKRLYSKPAFRGEGLGRCLAEAAIDKACALGYARMVLDTLPQMVEAQRLYRSLGFKQIAGYYSNPLQGVRYLVRQLEVEKQ